MKLTVRAKKKEDANTDIVYVKDFGDRYHKSEYDPDDETMREALSIRRIYKKQSEFRMAVANFNDYFYKIVEKYGGPKLFRLALLSGQVEDYLPPIPRLKNKRYKGIIGKNIILSEPNIKKVDPELIYEAVQGLEHHDLFLAAVGKQMKGIDKIDEFIEKNNTDSNPLAKSREISALENYFARRHKEEEEERHKTVEDITLTQMLSDEFYDILDNLSGTDGEELVGYGGELISRNQIETIEIIKKLNEFGWNTVKILNARRVDDKILNITKKQRKDMKRARKANKKAEGYMASMLTDGKFSSFSELDDAMSSSINESIFARFRD